MFQQLRFLSLVAVLACAAGAWPSAQLPSWQDPVKLEVFSRRAQRVTIQEGGKQSVEVRR